MLPSCRKCQARDGVCKGAGGQKTHGGMVGLIFYYGGGKEKRRKDQVQAG